MLKINYPKRLTELNAFHKSYVQAFDIATLDNDLYDFFDSQANLRKFLKYTASSILLLPIKNLYDLSEEINVVATANQIQRLKLIFNYDYVDSTYRVKQQPTISKFFMENKVLNLSTCFYCNVDHINSFDDIDDYQSGDDFYLRASRTELMNIEGIGKVIADKIIHARKMHTTFNSLPLTPRIIKNLKELKVSERKNHFTLDHVLDKASHPIASLSIYNFVPSCYSCNSKFKGSFDLIKNSALEYLSPTSKNYAFSDFVRFKIFFPLTSSFRFLDIKSVNDFVLNFEMDAKGKAYEDYILAFKLRSRYIFHKREAIKLIEKRKKYSQSQLKEIATIAKVTIEQIKKDIFGEELFDNNFRYSSLSKLKRDIAKNIGIDGVI